MADITRDQFNKAKGVVRKLAQQGTHVVDADFNEQARLDEYRVASLLNKLVSGLKVRFGNGFTITPGVNSTAVQAGFAAVELSTGEHYLIELTSNALQSWSTATTRTDYIYLDIVLQEYAPAPEPGVILGIDTSLINPEVGVETTRDIRLDFTVEQIEDAAVPAPATGHFHITLATIQRTAGQETITANDVTNHFNHWETANDDSVPTAAIQDGAVTNIKLANQYLKQDGSIELQGDMSVAADVTIDGVDLSEDVDLIWAQALVDDYGEVDTFTDYNDSTFAQCFQPPASGSNTFYKKIRVQCRKRPNHKGVRLTYEHKQVSSGFGTDVRLTVNGSSQSLTHTDNLSFQDGSITVDVSGETDGSVLDILVEMQDGSIIANTVGMRRVVIEALKQ